MGAERMGESPMVDQSHVAGPRDSFFLSQLRRETRDVAAVKQEIETFLALVGSLEHLGEEALTALLIWDYFQDQLAPVQRETVSKIVLQGYNESLPMRVYALAADLMSQTVGDFISRRNRPFDCWLPASLPYPLANQLLNLKSSGVVKGAARDMEVLGLKGYLVTRFNDPQTGMWGIWMSADGQPYDPDKVRQP